MRGRGNTTWKMAKKPFRFKFDKKQSPFGLAKGKSWVLLANFLSDAQLNNAIAMRTAQLVGASHANHMIPVELYINGSYRGLYNLTEQVDLASNSVVVPDESKAALLEWDTYDGDPKRDSTYKLPVDLKAPEIEDYVTDYGKEAATLYQETLNSEIQKLTRAVLAERTAEVVDVPSLAAFYYVFDLTGNLELRHPKSVNVWRANIFDPQSKWVFGPVWDFDWAYGYEHTGAFATINPPVLTSSTGKAPKAPAATSSDMPCVDRKRWPPLTMSWRSALPSRVASTRSASISTNMPLGSPRPPNAISIAGGKAAPTTLLSPH